MSNNKHLYSIFDISDINFNIFDENSYTYNLGDLLNMPYFFAGYNNTPHHNNEIYDLYKKTAEYYNESILNIYDKLRIDPMEPIPNIQRIKDSIDTYIENNINDERLKTLFNICTNDKTLVVHLRSGDFGIVDDEYINKINTLAEKYDTILIICGINKNPNSGIALPSVQECISNLKISLNKLSSNMKVLIDTSEPDIHVCVMRKAKNLLIHLGGFSVLGAFVFTGNNLYLTHKVFPLEYAQRYNNNNNNFFNIIPPHTFI